MVDESVAAFLRTLSILQDLSGADLTALAEYVRERQLAAGTVLFREGDIGQEMFFVRSGLLVISKLVTGSVEQVLTREGPGGVFGDMSLFDESPRSATVQAESDTVLLSLDRDSLGQLVQNSPRAAAAFLMALSRAFVQRLRATTDLVAEVTRWGLEATGLDVEELDEGGGSRDWPR